MALFETYQSSRERIIGRLLHRLEQHDNDLESLGVYIIGHNDITSNYYNHIEAKYEYSIRVVKDLFIDITEHYYDTAGKKYEILSVTVTPDEDDFYALRELIMWRKLKNN